MVKNPPAKAGDVRDESSIPGSRRYPGEGHGNPLQCSCLKNPMDRGAWRAAVPGVTHSRARLSGWHFRFFSRRGVSSVLKFFIVFNFNLTWFHDYFLIQRMFKSYFNTYHLFCSFSLFIFALSLWDQSKYCLELHLGKVFRWQTQVLCVW